MSYNTILATAPLTATGYHLKATGTALGQSLIWDNGTNVGIGNTNTSYTLDVSGSLRSTTSAYFATASGSVGIGSTTIYNGGGFGRVLSIYETSTVALSLVTSAKQFQVGIAGTDNDYRIYDFTNTTYRFAINGATGNVGIGTTTPGAKLQVEGTIFSSVRSATIDTDDGVSNNFQGYGGYWALRTDLSNNFNIDVYNNGTPKTSLTILQLGGNVGIGTSTPSEKLHLYDASYPVIRMSAGAATTDSYYLYANQSARFYITNVSSGNGAYLIYNSASGWTGVSDARWKTDWTDLDGSLSLINRLNIGKYKMLNNDKQPVENARWDYGIKAQELLDIIPDAVDVPKDENDKYGVIHNIVFYNAVKAIQELSAQVQEQNQTIQNLQEQINILAK